MSLKSIKAIFQGKPQRVGDGFIGRSLIPHNSFHEFSPFMLLDHHGPMRVLPSPIPKGVDAHPHRGIETITIVYEGALQHRDSAGNKGTLFAGDVQWMTAASGLVHEEKHELEFSKTGGVLNFVQLWTNLPRAYKMTPPRYQEIAAANIPNHQITEGVTLRLIAGETMGLKGVADTYNPVFLADIIVTQKSEFTLQLPENQNLAIYPTEGSITLNGEKTIAVNEIALLKQEGISITISVTDTARFLI
jgi:quercetin 2,3-dioxygenase